MAGRWENRLALLLIVVGCSLLYLQRGSLWLDEASVVMNLRMRSVVELWSSPLSNLQVFPRVYLTVLWMVLHLAGTPDPYVMRALPWAAMVAGLFLWFRLARSALRSRALAWTYLALALANPLVLEQAAQVKQYSLDVLLTAVGAWALFRLLWDASRDPQRREAHAYLLLFLVAIGSHMAWIPTLAMCAVLGLRALSVNQRLVNRAWAALGILAVGIVVLLLTDVLPQSSHRANMARFWSGFFLRVWPPWALVPSFLQLFTQQLAGEHAPWPLLWRAVFGLCVLGMLVVAVAPPDDARRVWARAGLAILGLGSVLSALGLLPLGSRIGLGLLAPLLLAVMAVFDRGADLLSRPTRVAVLGAFASLALLHTAASFHDRWAEEPRENLHLALPFLADRDWVLIDPCLESQWALLTEPLPPKLRTRIGSFPVASVMSLAEEGACGSYLMAANSHCPDTQRESLEALGEIGEMTLKVTAPRLQVWWVDTGASCALRRSAPSH